MTRSQSDAALNAAAEKILAAIQELESCEKDVDDLDDLPYRLDRILKDLNKIKINATAKG